MHVEHSIRLVGENRKSNHRSSTQTKKKKLPKFCVKILFLIVIMEPFLVSYYASINVDDIHQNFPCLQTVTFDTPLLQEILLTDSHAQQQQSSTKITLDTGDFMLENIVVRRRICMNGDENENTQTRKFDNVELHVNVTAHISKRKHICLPWSIKIDDWWTYHPGWKTSTSNDTHYCFESMNPKRAQFFRNLHQIQHPTNKEEGEGECRNVFTKPMWQSGWGADMAHIVDGLLYAVDHHVPFQVFNFVPWLFAYDVTRTQNPLQKNQIRAVCPTADLNCYFLPLSSCRPNPNRMTYGTSEKVQPKYKKYPDFYYRNTRNVTQQPLLFEVHHRWMMQYATRPQTWLRKAIHELSKQIPLEPPCTVLHVRRADVVLDGGQSRRYHSIKEYMDRTDPDISQTIFLVTDDENAIQEALREYPEREWVYVPRPRFKGAEGGWGNAFPSKDTKFEVIVMLTIFEKVTECQALIHSQSNFAQLLVGYMLDASSNSKDGGGPTFVNLDAGKKHTEVYNSSFFIG